MGLHHEGTHGRVFHGLDARKHLDAHKRDSHGDNIKLNIPDHIQAAARPADPAQAFHLNNKAAADDEVATYTSVVYQTLSANFDGPVAGYTTLSAGSTATAKNVAQTDATPSAKSAASAVSSTMITSSAAPVSPSSVADSLTSSVEDGSNNKSFFLNAPASALATSASATVAAAAVGGTPLSATQAGALAGPPLSATRAPTAQDGPAMSTGAKAGLAIGIVLALLLAAGLLFFCWRRRRNPNARDESTNEKRGSNASSLFGGKAMSEKRASAFSVARSPHSAASTAPRLSIRPVTQFLPSLSSDVRKNSVNGLDAASAVMSEKPKSMWERRSQTTQNPFDEANVVDEKSVPPSTPINPFDEPEAKGSETSPAATTANVDTAAAVPILAKGPNNVHRVQLDFKPSMEDELELKSGQLVRMLHAYDDGWALCIRMDRSQQGVVPRTCLSKLPVKPRPQGPPPQGSRSMSPIGPNGMAPRPLTPTGRDRTDSNAGLERPSTPTGVPARKPVPGQAM